MHLHYPPLRLAEGILKWYDAGADGVFLFNSYPTVPLRHLPYPELLREETRSGEVYGRAPGTTVEWTEAKPDE